MASFALAGVLTYARITEAEETIFVNLITSILELESIFDSLTDTEHVNNKYLTDTTSVNNGTLKGGHNKTSLKIL